MSRRAKRRQMIADHQAQLQKLYKNSNHSVRGDDKSFIAKHIPTGCFELDMDTGGGWKIGTMHLLWGWEHTGKTLMAIKGAANAQKMCSACSTHMEPRLLEPDPEMSKQKLTHWLKARRVCMSCGCAYHKKEHPPLTMADYYGENNVPLGYSADDLVCTECGEANKIVELAKEDDYLDPRYVSCECGENDPMTVLIVDTEGSYDPDWYAKLGLNLSDVSVEQPEYAEQGIDIARKAISEGLYDVVVYDSFANLATSAEIEASMEDSHMATTAKKLNSFMRQIPGLIRSAFNEHGVKVTVFATNQVREKIGIYAGHTMFGGHGQKFAASTIVKFKRSKNNVEDLQYGKGGKDDGEYLGISDSAKISYDIGKCKSAPTSGRSGWTRLIKVNDGVLKAGTFDDVDKLFKAAKKTKVIRRPEGKKNGWVIKGEKSPRLYGNEGEIRMRILSDEHFKRELTNIVVRRVNDEWGEVRDLMG